MSVFKEHCVRIVDDDPAIQKYLTLLFRSKGIDTVSYSSAEAFISEDIVSEPGCALVDLNLPGMSGTELLHWISEQPEAIPVMVVTAGGTVELAASCFRNGAADLIEKPLNSGVLLDRVQRLLERDAALRLKRRQRDLAQRYFANLSIREREVMVAMCRGLCSKQIGSELGIATRTIEKHRARVMAKLHVDSIADVVRMAIELQLDLPPIRSLPGKLLPRTLIEQS